MTAAIDSKSARHLVYMRRALAALGLLACVLIPDRAAAESRVKGRLEGFRLLQNPVWAEARDPKRHGYSFREPVPTVRAEFRRLYPHIPKEICVAVLAPTPQKASQIAVLVRVGGGRTTPVTIVVAPGTKLSFQNMDPFRHRLYAVGQRLFAPNDTLQGATREWTVPDPGVFEIRDEAAPSLRMWVVAEPSVAGIAYPSLKGDFSVPVEAAGDYRIQAFFAGKRVGPELPLTIKEADVDLSKTPLRLVDEKAAAKAAKEEEAGEAAKAEASGGEAKPEGSADANKPEAGAAPGPGTPPAGGGNK